MRKPAITTGTDAVTTVPGCTPVRTTATTRAGPTTPETTIVRTTAPTTGRGTTTPTTDATRAMATGGLASPFLSASSRSATPAEKSDLAGVCQPDSRVFVSERPF